MSDSAAPIAGWKTLPLPLCLGGSVFGWLIEPAESHAVLDRYYELGGRLIDTSDAYSAARRPEGADSENLIGTWARSRGVTDLRVVTKFGRSPDLPGLRPETVQDAVARSLERVGVPGFEALLAHGDDPSRTAEEVATAFAGIGAGEARHIGISNFTAERTTAVVDAATALAVRRVELIQQEHSLAVRNLDPAGHGLGIMATGALAQGFLTGKFRGAVTRVGHRQLRSGERYAGERYVRLLDAVQEVAERHHVSQAAIALRWLIQQPDTIPVASVTRPDQLDAFSEAAQMELTESDLARLAISTTSAG